MSLQDLPPELFKLIADPLRTCDYLSLCLTSKRLLYLTRPLLYKTARLNLSKWTWDESESSVPGTPRYRDQIIRDRFFRTLSKNRQFAEFITSLEIISDPQKLKDTPRLTSIIHLLRASVHLLHISLERHEDGHESLPLELLDAIPTTLVSLKIVDRPLEVKELAYLFSRLRLLTQLDFSRADFSRMEADLTYDVALPQSFRTLDLTIVDYSFPPFFASLIANSPNLKEYKGAFYSTRFLVLLDLSRLTTLILISMTGTVDRESLSDSARPKSMEEVTFKLRQLVEKAPNLRRLKVYLGYYYGCFDNSLPAVSILHYLPPTLKELALVGYASDTLFFTTLDLLRYLASPLRSPNVLSLQLHAYHERDRVVELCEDRRIILGFVFGNEGWKHWKL
ncbi:hypothetical protein JCM3765_001792 [Sporobolomyces pararoseus]